MYIIDLLLKLNLHVKKLVNPQLCKFLILS